MNNNSKIGLSLIICLGFGCFIGAGSGVLLGFFMSAVGFDIGIWKVFWFVFWACFWIGMLIGLLIWGMWLKKSNL
ncbi:MAG: hypothetical protein MH252_03345 [Thermosynechococcaceae cyanobacterium MS004]|nr:hypothetical protein [Thermosynechococcaceae cyanobacterium MS004]